jgi:PhnB protein
MPQPPQYHSVTPYLNVADAGAALDFYQKAFGVLVREVMPGADGKVIHAEFQFGDSVLMLGQAMPSAGYPDPKHLGGSPITLYCYVDDVDTAFAKALSAGATQLEPVSLQFYGDKRGTLSDPFGHRWSLATHVEDVSVEEMHKRMAAMGA